MTRPAVGVLHTSVFVAWEAGRQFDDERRPDQVVVSVVTLAELRAGVLAAQSAAARSTRLATVQSLDEFVILPIDESVAHLWADMRAHLAETGRRVNVNDLWIAATAAANGIPVVTQDTDFDAIEGVAGLEIVRV